MVGVEYLPTIAAHHYGMTTIKFQEICIIILIIQWNAHL
jgi:hypothetical protein